MKFAQAIEVRMDASLLPAITLARIDILKEVKVTDRSHSLPSENTIKTISMMDHIETPRDPLKVRCIAVT